MSSGAKFIELRSALGKGFVCARLSRGSVVLVVSNAGAIHGAREYLKNGGRRGRVEVASAQEYFDREYALAGKIKASAPPRFPRNHVLWEFVTQAAPCPVVRIELGFRGHVRRAVLRWAKRSVKRYGADRVVMQYYVPQEPL